MRTSGLRCRLAKYFGRLAMLYYVKYTHRFAPRFAAVLLLVAPGLLRAQTPQVAAASPLSAVRSERVQYALVGGHAVQGYLSRPAGRKKPPSGLILIHAWWGLNQHMRFVAEQLAHQGYVVLAVDLFRGQVTRKRPVAARLADIAGADAGGRLSNLEQAVNYMKTRQHVNRLGVVGWSLGGRWAFRIASDLPQAINALAVFYAPPYTEPSELTPLRMPILAFFGGRDPFVPPQIVARFQWAAELASVRAKIHIYPHARAGFDNPESSAYDAADAEDAQRELARFLTAHLGD